jgi:N-acetylmuramoyl-L-alanine amidase
MVHSGFAAVVLLAMLPALLGLEDRAQDSPQHGRALPRAEVLIDVGHGGVDGGTHFGQTLEKDINLAVAGKLYLLLKSNGIDAVMNRVGDYALSDDNRWQRGTSRHRKDLSQRRQLTVEIPTRLLVSIHVNWSGNASGRGPLVLHQNEGRSALLASFVQQALNRQQHMIRYPRVGKAYYLLNAVDSPAIIVEIGFLSYPQDRKIMTNSRGQLRIAAAIADGLREYLSVIGA